MMEILLGFDPGGEGKFGWAVCIDKQEGLNVLDAGVADHAKGAIDDCLRAIPRQASVKAAGIDAPMFWVTDGSREADRLVRKEIGRRGAKSPGGTVQHFNSLQGACLIQGLLILKLVRHSFPTLPITEAHPKALLWLIGLANKSYEPKMVKLSDIADIKVETRDYDSEDERDAILGAFTAQAMVQKKSGWEDLLSYERDIILADKPPIAYWMPRI